MALLNNPRFQALDANGNPYSGGKVYTYISGTSTAKAAFSNRALTTEHTNPIILDSAGSATIYLSGSYKIILKDADDVTVWTIDEVEGIPDEELDALEDEVDALDADIGVLDDGAENQILITTGGAIAWKDNITQLMTNYASTTLAANDVVVLYATADSSVVNTTTQSDTRPVFISAATTAVGASGRFYYCGRATVAVTGAVARGDFLRCSATSKLAESAGAYPVYGVFGRALTVNASGVGTVTAWLFGYTFDDNLQNIRKTVKKATAEIVSNSTTLQNDDELTFTIAASEVWRFTCFIRVMSALARGIKFGFSIPTGATMSWGSRRTLDDTAHLTSSSDAKSATDGVSCGTSGATTENIVILEGVVINSTTAGSVTLQWAQVDAAVADSTVMANSYIEAWKL